MRGIHQLHGLQRHTVVVELPNVGRVGCVVGCSGCFLRVAHGAALAPIGLQERVAIVQIPYVLRSRPQRLEIDRTIAAATCPAHRKHLAARKVHNARTVARVGQKGERPIATCHPSRGRIAATYRSGSAHVALKQRSIAGGRYDAAVAIVERNIVWRHVHITVQTIVHHDDRTNGHACPHRIVGKPHGARSNTSRTMIARVVVKYPASYIDARWRVGNAVVGQGIVGHHKFHILLIARWAVGHLVDDECLPMHHQRQHHHRQHHSESHGKRFENLWITPRQLGCDSTPRGRYRSVVSVTRKASFC